MGTGRPDQGGRENCPLEGTRGLCRSGVAGSTPASHPRPGQVPEDELVSTLKQLVSEKLNVPVRQQRLLFKGKALAGNRERSHSGSPAGSQGMGCTVQPQQQRDGSGRWLLARRAA